MHHSPEFEALCAEARSRVTEVTVDDVVARQAQGLPFRLVDVREDDEWRAGHAAGAEHIGRGVLERDIRQKVPDKTEEVILYCGGGYRSALAADNLGRMGYTRIRSLAGGWKAWNARGLPTSSE